jgi:dihydroorotate dehydrogenase
MIDAFTLLRPLLHRLPPETVHALGLRLLPPPFMKLKPAPELAVEAFGLAFANPIGLAAGFDKNAVAINRLLMQGFGFVEAGTVTPKPQPGNPKPRIFRLTEDEAVINRLGFNNDGLAEFVRHFERRDRRKGIAGANIGKNKDAVDAAADYVTGLRAVYPHADYITINISSPNTQGLRDLQQKDALGELLATLEHARQGCIDRYNKRVPLLLKVAPDLTMHEKEAIAQQVLAHGIDGLIVSNTTVLRPDSLLSEHRHEQGGLSGRPLFILSTETLKDFYRLTGGKLPLVGVGGIASAQDAYMKIRAGATLVQLYSALVYQGFGLVRKIHTELRHLLTRDGFAQIGQAVGIDSR